VAAITMLGVLFSHHPRSIGELLTSGE